MHGRQRVLGLGVRTHLLLICNDARLNELKHILHYGLSQLSVVDLAFGESLDELCEDQSADHKADAVLIDILDEQMDVGVQACLVFAGEEFGEERLVSRRLVLLVERSQLGESALHCGGR